MHPPHGHRQDRPHLEVRAGRRPCPGCATGSDAIAGSPTGALAGATASYWAWPNHLAIWGSLAVYILVLLICGFALIRFYPDAVALYQVFPILFSSAEFYFTVLFVPTTCLLRDYAWK